MKISTYQGSVVRTKIAPAFWGGSWKKSSAWENTFFNFFRVFFSVSEKCFLLLLGTTLEGFLPKKLLERYIVKNGQQVDGFWVFVVKIWPFLPQSVHLTCSLPLLYNIHIKRVRTMFSPPPKFAQDPWKTVKSESRGSAKRGENLNVCYTVWISISNSVRNST